MAGKVVSLVTPDDEAKICARTVLEEAIKMDPHGVIVFAYNGDDIQISVSGRLDKCKLLGALEMAKMEVWNG